MSGETCELCPMEDGHEPGCENHPGFDLFPADVTFPALYANESKKPDEVPVVVKLFCGPATWYITEYDREEDLAFGWCDLGGGFPELGYVDGGELRRLRVRGMRVERDLWFGEHTLGEVKRGEV